MQQNIQAQDSQRTEPESYLKYMQQVAQLVRDMRAQREMTRKDLSKKSDISERYLAQVETGKANISIALLWRLAEAMDVSFNNFLPQENHADIELAPLKNFLATLSAEEEKKAYEMLLKHFANEGGPVGGVALIGLRGAGKSTLGKQLAEQVGLPFVVLTQVIEKLAGLGLQEILSMFGERAFRRLEREALDYVIDNYDRVILEVGGNLVSEKETFEHLLSAYYTIWVKAKLDDHISRVLTQANGKPLRDRSHALSDLQHILAEREPLYRKANWVIDTSERGIDECVDELVAKSKCYCCKWQWGQ